ncbi:hypothetical protein BU24DRAFT_385506 [Aaosphaeria arxii CBS 175.79]|uniref:Uncharacterized protein n=1 Tax=Aaosphaeria arxii CBS 175.79 TaxID=1450172 RepID=A0A6A5Y0L8_9PLEO|nr:uncharacterized protein BU24DRAFT_385506 [Aaosphaeria arxii CBS 175.79]KAF2018809.1 hypothetical protein BU24DRAFT_385506 [Aaosphaeria arxii CBS 175.79]
MPPLKDFSDNQFLDHSDFKKGCIALLQKLRPYQSKGGARIRLPLATGTHFDDIAAQLEGFARPLWAVGALLHGEGICDEEVKALTDPYVRGLANGTDPNHPEYWGPVVVRDQRMVEMEIISFALLAAPETMFHNQMPDAQQNITQWLYTLNGKDFPTTNWLWFRVMTNLALVKVCGIPHADLEQAMKSDLDAMEQFYLGEGWAADGIWNDNCRQADYYSGSFAIQFSQLLYVKFAQDLDPDRCDVFRQRAANFSTSFWRYFHSDGAAIPFGRSLTYRFAFAGFWSAAAFAEVELPAPLHDLGVIKGLLLRHLRWWSNKDDIFNVDGTLTIGFVYPNMYMCEDYNSPQSPYWAMKSFVAVALPTVHPFWQAEEKALPDEDAAQLSVVSVKPASQIICGSSRHHYLLSTGQFCPWPLKATEAKYGKFAYSSHFGFSVPTGSSVMAQIAPDSTIALSKDDGDTWRVPWKFQDHKYGTASLVNKETGSVEKLPTLTGVWKPWKDADIEVATTLIPPCSRWPDWYVRIYKVTAKDGQPRNLRAVEGGFSLYGRGAKAGEVLPSVQSSTALFDTSTSSTIEGTLETPKSSLIGSGVGISGIKHLSDLQSGLESAGKILKPDANTNLIWQRTLIPTLEHTLGLPGNGDSIVFATGVFAIGLHPESRITARDYNTGHSWEDSPILETSKRNIADTLYYIQAD